MNDQSGGAASQENSVHSEAKDVVKYETYSRVLNEAKKLKDKLREYETVLQQSQEAKLKEQNEFKTLAEQYKAQRDQALANLAEKEAAINNGLKFQEFEKHLGGRLKKRDYASFVDFDKIVIDPETKSVDEGSVKAVAADFIKEHSSLIDFGTQGKLPNQAASTFVPQGKRMEDLDVKELEKLALQLAAEGKIK